MGINYKNYEDESESVEMISEKDVEILPKSYRATSVPRTSFSGMNAMPSGIGPVELSALVGLASTVINGITEVVKCISAVSIEKQRTKQIVAQSKAQVRIAEEQTKQVMIQEKEATERLSMQLENNLQMRALELKELKMKLEDEAVKREQNQAVIMKQLDTMSDIAQSIIAEKEALYMLIQDAEDEEQRLEYCRLTDNMNSYLIRLVDTIYKGR